MTAVAGSPSVSARYVALVRALMDRPRTDNGDVEAERLLHASLLDERRSFWSFMSSRTRFVDDCVLAALADGVRQVVTLGAGYDGRALRFRTPGVRFVELDLAATQRDKRARLDRLDIDAGGLVLTPADLTVDGVDHVLATAGCSGPEPSLVVCEGVFLYLPADAVERTLATARIAAGPQGRLSATFALGTSSAATSSSGENRQTFYRPEEVEALLRRTGWHTRVAVTPDSVDPGPAVALFVSATAAPMPPSRPE
jgi:methyltransferase (TIGR00027 family)